MLLTEIRWTFTKSKKCNEHNLPAPLIISLTSFPPRFATLHLTLKCLLLQNIKPDRVILWISHSDKNTIPRNINSLKKFGLEIKFHDDIKSYKKIIPTIETNPEAFIVTADDDLYYPKPWLNHLASSFNPKENNVICHRAHEIKFKNAVIQPYKNWDLNTVNSKSNLIFPTSGAGALYPPRCFHNDITNELIFTKLCPNADDIWLYWMMRLNGYTAKKTESNGRIYTWPKSQSFALKNTNYLNDGNDKQIKAMIKHYGFPE